MREREGEKVKGRGGRKIGKGIWWKGYGEEGRGPEEKKGSKTMDVASRNRVVVSCTDKVRTENRNRTEEKK